MLTFPDLQDVFTPIEFDQGEEVFDTDFNDTGDMVSTGSGSRLERRGLGWLTELIRFSGSRCVVE